MIRSTQHTSYQMARTLRIGGLYTFSHQKPEPGFLFSGESHPMPELVYVTSGSLHSVADGRDLLLAPGEIAVYGPNQWHMQYADIEVAPQYISLVFDVEGVDLTPLLNRRIRVCPSAAALLAQMLLERESRDPYAQDMILSQLSMLLMILLRQESKNSPTACHPGENEILRRTQQYVASHIQEKLSVPLVARQVDVSPSYLTALFQKNLHISPGEYIRRVKLQESKHMIREGSRNFTEIAEMLQYSTVHHFSRQFKEKFGMTPSEYAKSVR